jgi:hypothetical protein
MIGNIAAGLYGTGVPPVTNSYASIATVTVGSGGTSSITFTDGGAWADYKHLQIRALVKSANSGSSFDVVGMTINSNNLTKNHYLYANGSSALAGVGGTNSVINVPTSGYTSVFAGAVIDILDFSSTTKNKTIRTLSGVDTNGAGELVLYSNLYAVNTNAITSLTFSISGVNIAEFSSFALYGIKD